MTIKKIIKEIIPPAILKIYRRAFSKTFDGYIWEGIYKNFKDAPFIGDGFCSEELTSATFLDTTDLLKKIKMKTIPYQINDENVILPLVAAFLCESQKSIKILDFGGGMGIGYVYLINSILNKPYIDYYIVETEIMCNWGGKKIFKNENQLHFISEIPQNLKGLDIIYICSSLQYIENYEELLIRLMKLSPKYFLFTKLSAGENPTYVSCQQNLPNTAIPYWFINVDELIQIMNFGNYTLQYKSALSRVYDQDNFPEQYRLIQTCNLLFKKR